MIIETNFLFWIMVILLSQYVGLLLSGIIVLLSVKFSKKGRELLFQNFKEKNGWYYVKLYFYLPFTIMFHLNNKIEQQHKKWLKEQKESLNLRLI